jgi:hypothetical protein
VQTRRPLDPLLMKMDSKWSNPEREEADEAEGAEELQ